MDTNARKALYCVHGDGAKMFPVTDGTDPPSCPENLAITFLAHCGRLLHHPEAATVSNTH